MKATHGLNYEFKGPPDDEPDQGWKDPEGRFDWRKPFALGFGEWDEWRDDMKARFPVRFFIYETIPDLWDDVWKYGIYRFFHDLKWKILHRYHPRHQYNIVRTNLEPGYYDPDTQIFESVFTLLTTFVEHNTQSQAVAWDEEDGHAEAWAEMNELVHWYKEIYPNREKELDRLRPEPRVSFKKLMSHKYDDEPEMVEYRKYLDMRMETEKLWEEEDEANLIRAIKLRPYLWYA